MKLPRMAVPPPSRSQSRTVQMPARAAQHGPGGSGVSPQIDWGCIAAKAGGCLLTCGPDIPCLIGCAGFGILSCL